MRHVGDREGNREAQGKIRAHLMAMGPTGAGGGSRVSILEQKRLRGIWSSFSDLILASCQLHLQNTPVLPALPRALLPSALLQSTASRAQPASSRPLMADSDACPEPFTMGVSDDKQ